MMETIFIILGAYMWSVVITWIITFLGFSLSKTVIGFMPKWLSYQAFVFAFVLSLGFPLPRTEVKTSYYNKSEIMEVTNNTITKKYYCYKRDFLVRGGIFWVNDLISGATKFENSINGKQPATLDKCRIY